MIYGYIRVSTDQQDTEAQKIGITELASKKGFVIEKWISDEGISGTVDYQKRKLGKLMKILNKGDIVFASEISRFARNLFMLFEILKYFTEKQIEMYTVKDNYNLDGSITSTVMAFAFGMAAQIERDMISKRTIEGLQQRRKAGVVLGRPIGSKSKKKKLDDKEQKIIEYLQAGLSYSAIARLLHVHRLTVSELCKEKGLNSYKTMYPQKKEKIEKLEISIGNNPNHKAHKIKSITIENGILIDMYRKSGYSLSALAKELEIGTHSLRPFLEKRGIWDDIVAMNNHQRNKVKSLHQIERETGIPRRNN